jgi:hypothetical protein
MHPFVMTISLHHWTTERSAIQILREGFRDPTCARSFTLGRPYLGVWLFSGPYPIDTLRPGHSQTLLNVEIRADESELASWFIEDWLRAPWREWCIPAAWVNANSEVTRAAVG